MPFVPFQDIQAIKDKAADALVKALGMESEVPPPEALAAAPAPPREEMAQLDVKNVKAKAGKTETATKKGGKKPWGLKQTTQTFEVTDWLSKDEQTC